MHLTIDARAGHPAIMDATHATEQLGWTPRYTGLEALRGALRHGGFA